MSEHVPELPSFLIFQGADLSRFVYRSIHRWTREATPLGHVNKSAVGGGVQMSLQDLLADLLGLGSGTAGSHGNSRFNYLHS